MSQSLGSLVESRARGLDFRGRVFSDAGGTSESSEDDVGARGSKVDGDGSKEYWDASEEYTDEVEVEEMADKGLLASADWRGPCCPVVDPAGS